jgi:hypothetical protein
MKTLLKSEELLQFGASVVLFAQLDYAWWVFPALLLLPDVSLIGYLISPRVGALTYNIGHHKGLALGLGVLGLVAGWPLLLLTGLILFAHACFDRVWGYGLKYPDAFKHTHLGTL